MTENRSIEDAGDRRRAKSSPDVVVDAILSGIRSGWLVPGQRLVEADLTHSLNVSRGPVREALKRLAAEGVITLNQNRGAYVRALTRKEVIDMLTVLEVITGLTAKLATYAIRHGTCREEFERAHEALMAFRDQGDSVDFMEARRRYYDVLLRAGGNEELKRAMPLMQIHLLRLQFQQRVSSEDRARQFREYERITAAILSGDATRAERMTKLHIRRTRMTLSRLPETAFLRGDRERSVA
ncbi:GntR family transcriptional regulator [Rhodosalinus halophilus]|uniref:GntR family transcriptional regulator n=1 Tax=Rhodosalinus halophilus TaxID=2259333 RepID=UPI001314E410|nr:GntR family transcriptional regulator [Rhodosalinus halophilus]